MWSATAGRRVSSRLLLSLRHVPEPSPRFPPVSGASATDAAAPTFLRASHLHSPAGPSQSGHRSPPASVGGVFSGVSYSATSTAEGAAVLGSLGAPASISVTQTVRDASEIMRHYGRCYWELSKARLSMLVVATSGAGYVLGSGSSIDFAGLCCTCAGTMMVAASANTLNQVFEVQNDSQMKRTKLRPLPSGRISLPHAVTWAASVGIAGTSLLALKVNYLAAGLAASNLIMYAFIYTPLKQIHPVNTWVGAIVGAIPPLLGWAAASGEMSLNAMILPAALYYWQIPHFMALAYLCRNDYITGGFRMFSFADVSGLKTALVSFRNCLYLLPLGFLAYDWGLTSKWFALESSLLTMSLSIAALLFVRNRTTQNARRMFRASLFYLPVFMSGLLLHRLPNQQDECLMSESSKLDGILLLDGQVHEDEDNGTSYGGNLKERNRNHLQARPPVAYASAAPFPFLPAPLYLAPDS